MPAAGCPVEHDFDPLSPAFLRDPFEILATLDSDTPVFYAPEIDYYVVTRHAYIDAVFHDNETFSAANAQLPLVPLDPEAGRILLAGGHRPQPSMVSLDEPAHQLPPEHLVPRPTTALGNGNFGLATPDGRHRVGPPDHSGTGNAELITSLFSDDARYRSSAHAAEASMAPGVTVVGEREPRSHLDPVRDPGGQCRRTRLGAGHGRGGVSGVDRAGVDGSIGVGDAAVVGERSGERAEAAVDGRDAKVGDGEADARGLGIDHPGRAERGFGVGVHVGHVLVDSRFMSAATMRATVTTASNVMTTALATHHWQIVSITATST
jgi:hypothetical protein